MSPSTLERLRLDVIARQSLSGAKNADQALRLSLVSILVLSTIVYIMLAAAWPKFSRAEVFFAECVREMFEAEALVTPLYHGTPFFDKPILTYWSIGVSYWLFGVSHLSARIPSILAALLTTILTAWATKQVFGMRSAVFAAMVLSSSFMYLSFANLCMSDMSLVMFDTLSLVLLFCAVEKEKHRNICFWLGALSMGLAFLTKGPVGIVLPASAFAVYLSLAKQWHTVSFFKHVIPSTLIMLAAALPWFMAAYRENGMGAIGYFFIRENLQRFAASTYDTHKPFYFMVQSFFTGMLPWSVLLPFAAAFAIKESKSNNLESRTRLLLGAWIVVLILFFSFSRGKIDYYALPVFPAAAILIAAYLNQAANSTSRNAGKTIAFIFAGLLCLGGIAIAALMLNWQSDLALTLVLSAALLVPGIFMLLALKEKKLFLAYKISFIGVCMGAMAVAGQLMPELSRMQAVLYYCPAIHAAPESTRIAVYDTLKNWIDEITFQTGKEPLALKNEAMAALSLSAPTASLTLIPQDVYERMPQELRANLQVVESRPFIKRSLSPGYLFSQGKKLSESPQLLLVAKRKSSPRL